MYVGPILHCSLHTSGRIAVWHWMYLNSSQWYLTFCSQLCILVYELILSVWLVASVILAYLLFNTLLTGTYWLTIVFHKRQININTFKFLVKQWFDCIPDFYLEIHEDLLFIFGLVKFNWLIPCNIFRCYIHKHSIRKLPWISNIPSFLFVYNGKFHHLQSQGKAIQ